MVTTSCLCARSWFDETNFFLSLVFRMSANSFFISYSYANFYAVHGGLFTTQDLREFQKLICGQQHIIFLRVCNMHVSFFLLRRNTRIHDKFCNNMWPNFENCFEFFSSYLGVSFRQNELPNENKCFSGTRVSEMAIVPT